MLLKWSLQAGLMTGTALGALALVYTPLFFLLRATWPLIFTPVLVTGVGAIARARPAVNSWKAALLAGAIAGVAASLVSVVGLAVAASIQSAIPNWPYAGAPQGSP